jgi:hypothetical protein
LVDALGNLARFVVLPCQRHDSIGVEPLLHGVALGALIGDKGFDNDWLRHERDQRKAPAVIAPKADRKTFIPRDFAMYAWRHLPKTSFATSNNIARSPPVTKDRSEPRRRDQPRCSRRGVEVNVNRP